MLFQRLLARGPAVAGSDFPGDLGLLTLRGVPLPSSSLLCARPSLVVMALVASGPPIDRLLALVGQPLALVSDRFALVGQPLTLISDRFALVGQPFTPFEERFPRLSGLAFPLDALAFRGDLLTLLCDQLALVGHPLALRGHRCINGSAPMTLSTGLLGALA